MNNELAAPVSGWLTVTLLGTHEWNRAIINDIINTNRDFPTKVQSKCLL